MSSFYPPKRKLGEPRSVVSDYPGQNCWTAADVTMMNYIASCRATLAGTAGDVIMFNAGHFDSYFVANTTANSSATFMNKYGPTYSVRHNTATDKPGIWLNLLKNGATADYSVQRSDYGVHFVHTVTLKFPQRSPSYKTFINNAASGSFMFIIANADGGILRTNDADVTTKHYNQTFELYGGHAGLVLTTLTTTTDLTNGHVCEATFTNLEEIGWENTPALTLFSFKAGADVASEKVFYDQTVSDILSWVTVDTVSTTEELIANLPKEENKK